MSRLNLTRTSTVDPAAFLVGLVGVLLSLGIVTLPVDQYTTQQTALLFLLAGKVQALSLEITFKGTRSISPAWIGPLLAFGALVIVATIRTLAILLGA